MIGFEMLAGRLARLIREFGPPAKTIHPEYPFWWLQSDSLWEIPDGAKCERRKGHGDAKKSELVKHGIEGGFPEAYYKLVQADHLVCELASNILIENFPSSLHDDILAAVGLQGFHLYRRQPRDPLFRERIMRAYSHQCAFCGFDLRLDQLNIGLEAAHIRWHQAGGPDVESNGLALCVLHHKLFDLGAFTLDLDTARILVSERVHGSTGVDEWALQYHGSPPRVPLRAEYLPMRDHIMWHHSQVFRGPARQI
jgi:putative restriction endonuclease